MATPAAALPALSRNDPCWCGSGKRFKACHGALSNGGVAHAPNVFAVAERLAQQALAAQRADDLELAESRYRACLAIDPNHADALHMLGVVRLSAFDFAEARQLIEAAGALTQWQFPQFRHNYGYLLSAYLPAGSARPTDEQRRALQSLRARRYAQRDPARQPSCTVVVRWRSAQGLAQSVHAAATAVDVDEQAVTNVNIKMLRLRQDDAHTSCAELQRLLLATPTDYVTFASAETPHDPLRTAALIELLEDNRAGWGFSTPRYAADSHQSRACWPLVLSDAAAGLSNTQFTENVSAMCFATPLLPLTVDNLVVRRELLTDIRWSGASLTHALSEIVLALCQQDEPCVSLTVPLLISATTALALAQDFERNTTPTTDINGAQQRYITDALAQVSFANPFAPSLASQGLSFLKRPLRFGVGAKLTAPMLADIAQRIDATQPSRHALRNDGFDLVGFARAESGLGENVRAFSRALTASALPHSVIDIDIETGMRKADHSLDALIATAPSFRHQLILVNPDSLNEAVHHGGVAAISSAYRIGYWLWELEKLPLSWVRAAAPFRELWAASDFVREAVAASVSIPVYKVATPIRPPQPSRPYARAEFGLDDRDFVFLFSFAYGSGIFRKNPWAVVRAFREAFPASDGKFSRVKLAIKSVQSELFETEKAALHALAAHDPRIVFMDRFMSRDQVMGLQVSADCYVSLHRSEGFGLGMAECMAIGKPVIGTAYSANLDFMNEGNSLLVDYSLINVGLGEYPDGQPQVWADADVDCAARHMRRVFSDAHLRNALGQAAQKFLRQHYAPTVIGEQVRAHLQRLNETRNS